MRVLIVRLSSMGDVVHTLPAITDAAKAIPGLRFDWAVDEAFAQIPSWHPSVETVLPAALRRWGPKLTSDEVSEFRKKLRSRRYDFIVDLQGEFKSALIARFARGVRCGYDATSVHERGAQLMYRKKFGVAKSIHSIARMRRLLAQSLSYSYAESEIDYGVDRARLLPAPLEIKAPYVVYIHSTSWESKNWPEEYWRDLTRRATDIGLRVVLPWGSEAERQRSQRIAAENESVFVLPQLSISEKAWVISRAVATVGLDTGLSHIAAALGVPSVTIYGATDPKLCGAMGKHQVQIASDFECVACHQEDCFHAERSGNTAACFAGLTADRVWQTVQDLVRTSEAGSKEFQLA